ncbi:MAG TPA: hypothetical protein VGM56_06160, partial [Byssovorax sp.]
MRLLSFVSLLALVACGSRSPLDAGGADDGSGAGASGPACPTWSAVSDPIQLTDIPSILAPQAALATSGGVLVGYADEQFPPVDAAWRVQLVGFDGLQGADFPIATRSGGALGWTAISMAQGTSELAAAMSDQSQGTVFMRLDANGKPHGPPANPSRLSSHDLLGTPAGFSVLESAFDPDTGVVSAVSLALVDQVGHFGGSRALVSSPTPTIGGFQRVGFDDGSFTLVWFVSGPCEGCGDAHARHFDWSGDPLADETILEAFGPMSYASPVAASSGDALLLAWSARAGSRIELDGATYDEDGRLLAGPLKFADTSSDNAPELAAVGAPGGDFLVGWIDDGLTSNAHVHVVSVARSGGA